MKLIYNIGTEKVIGEYETMQEVWNAFTQEMAKRFVYLKGPINVPFMEAKGFIVDQSQPKIEKIETLKTEPIEEKQKRTETRKRTSSVKR